MRRASASRVAARFHRASPIRVEVIRDETEKAIQRFGKGVAVARMLDPVPMFRVMDGEELRSVFDTGEIKGGSYAVPGERAFGSQWGTSLPEVAKWGDVQRGKRLGHELFVAEIDGKGRVFSHLSGADGQLQPDSGIVSLDSKFCNTGLGCSFKVGLGDVRRWYLVDENGTSSPISKRDLEGQVDEVGLTPRKVDLWMGWSISSPPYGKRIIKALQYIAIREEVRGLSRNLKFRREREREQELGISYNDDMDESKLSRLLFKWVGNEQGSWWYTSMAQAVRDSETSRADVDRGVFSLNFCLTADVAVPHQGVDLKDQTGTVKMVQVYIPPMDGKRGYWTNIWQPWGSATFSWKGKNLTVK